MAWTDADLDAAYNSATSGGGWADSDLDTAYDKANPSFNNSVQNEATWYDKAASGFLSGVSGLTDMLGYLPGFESLKADQALKGRANSALTEEMLKRGVSPETLQTREAQNMISESAGTQSLGDMTRQGFDALTGVEGSTQIGPESLPYKAASYVPSTLSADPMAILSSLSAGTGDYAATKLGAPSWLGALLGGVGPSAIKGGLGYLAKPLTSEGQQVLAGQDLMRNAGKEGAANIETALAGGNADNLTYAEMANTPSAAMFQRAARQIPGEGSNSIEAYVAKREADQMSAIKALAPDALEGISPATRGAEIQGSAADIVKDAWKTAGEPYNLIDDSIDIPVQKEKYAIGSFVNKVFGDSPLDMKPDTRKIVDFFLTKEKTRTVGELKQLKSAAGSVYNEIYRANPKAPDLAVLGSIRNKVDTALERAMQDNIIPPEQVSLIKNAKDNYLFTGNKYGSTSVSQIVKRGGLDKGSQLAESGEVMGRGFQMSQEAVPKTIIRNQQNAKEFVQAFGGNKDLMTQARGTLADEMAKKPIESWMDFYEKKKPVFDEIFWNDSKDVKKALTNLASLKNVDKLATKASKGQSITTQGLTVMDKLFKDGTRGLVKLMASKTGAGGGAVIGLYTGNIPLAVASIGASKLAQGIENNIQTIIAKAMTDPELLKSLIAKGSKSNVSAALARLSPVVLGTMANAKDKTTSTNFIDKAMDRAETKTPKAPEIIEAKRVDPVKKVEAEIDKDPYYSALYEAESGRNPKAKNANSSASGGFQFINSTAKTLGLKDPMDLGESFQKVQELTDGYKKKFGDDPFLLYAAHYLGETVLDKYLDGKALTDKQQSQVDYLKSTALPRFKRIYNKKVVKT